MSLDDSATIQTAGRVVRVGAGDWEDGSRILWTDLMPTRLTPRQCWELADALLGGSLTDALNAADEGDARRAHAYLENAR